jgi:hypothetical protein
MNWNYSWGEWWDVTVNSPSRFSPFTTVTNLSFGATEPMKLVQQHWMCYKMTWIFMFKILLNKLLILVFTVGVVENMNDEWAKWSGHSQFLRTIPKFTCTEKIKKDLSQHNQFPSRNQTWYPPDTSSLFLVLFKKSIDIDMKSEAFNIWWRKGTSLLSSRSIIFCALFSGKIPVKKWVNRSRMKHGVLHPDHYTAPCITSSLQFGWFFCSRKGITRRKLLHNFVGNDKSVYIPNSLSYLLNALIWAICDKYNKMHNSFHLGDSRLKLRFGFTVNKK